MITIFSDITSVHVAWVRTRFISWYL